MPFHLTLSISPTLAAMLGDKALGDRYVEYLDAQLGPRRGRGGRVGGDPAFGPLARMYRELYSRRQGRLPGALRPRHPRQPWTIYYKKGRVELMTSGATHAFLPIFRDCREAVTAQIETAIIAHRKAIRQASGRGSGFRSSGWYPGVGEVLRSYNVQYTVVTTKGALLGEPTPALRVLRPRRVPLGPRRPSSGMRAPPRRSGPSPPAIPRTRPIGTSTAISASTSRPTISTATSRTRASASLRASSTGPSPDARRLSGPTNRPRPPPRPPSTPRRFLAERGSPPPRPPPPCWIRPPLMVCPFDAELFGHWWFEGPAFLEALFRRPPRAARSPGHPRRVSEGLSREPGLARPSSPPGATEASPRYGSTAPTTGSTGTRARPSSACPSSRSAFPTSRASGAHPQPGRSRGAPLDVLGLGPPHAGRQVLGLRAGARSRSPSPTSAASTTCSAPTRSAPSGSRGSRSGTTSSPRSTTGCSGASGRGSGECPETERRRRRRRPM